MEQELISQITASALMAYVIETIKTSKLFPFITVETKTLNRVAGVIGSLITSLGIHYSFDSTAGSLVITGLTLAGILHGLWHVANQFALQQLVYDTAINKTKVVNLNEAVKEVKQ